MVREKERERGRDREGEREAVGKRGKEWERGMISQTSSSDRLIGNDEKGNKVTK